MKDRNPKDLLSECVWKDHVASHKSYDNTLETLQWKNPKNSHHAVWYIRQHGVLAVWGDLGAATYRWYPDVSLRAIADTNLDYFVSKCEASRVGRSPYCWDNHQAEEDMRDYFAEFHAQEYQDSLERTERNEEASKFELVSGWRALGEDEHVWIEWLRSDAIDIFGQDWWEHPVVNAGKKLDAGVKLHHEGLKLAFEQLKKESAEPKSVEKPNRKGGTDD